jgi:hypothetical protein
VILGTLIGSAVATVVLSDDLRRTHERALRTAIQLSGSTMRLAAQEAEIDQAQFTRQIQLAEGSLKRLAMQPKRFWQWYAVALAQEFGIPVEARRAGKLAVAALGRKRMARADMRAAREAQAS